MAKLEIINWKVLQEMCKYFHISFDENRTAEKSCHHKLNTPKGHGWGICNYKDCPFGNNILRY